MQRIKNKRRASKSINAGSMADIAFLLLIFFLVTTTIVVDKGISVKLPPWESAPPQPIPERNSLKVKINANNELFVEEGPAAPQQLRQITKDFILNPGKSANRPSSPQKAVVSLLHDRGTSYTAYLEVYNEIMAAYNELWEEKAQLDYGMPFVKLPAQQQKVIRKAIPLVLSEAEPVELL
jgi:biopolymer transport protein ExbD